MPWGAYGAGKRSRGRAPAHARPAQQAEQALQLPKALLQQHCQKQGWNMPRFERLQVRAMCVCGGGGSAAAGARLG
jgi:hypothetical protein